MRGSSARALKKGEQIDVMLILEGTYPFVSGGVSSWVHQIIAGMKSLRFGIVFIGGARDSYEEMRFELPDNVLHLETHFLADARPVRPARGRSCDSAFYRASSEMHEAFQTYAPSAFAARWQSFVERLCEDPERHESEFHHSEQSWNEVTARYRASASNLPFSDYFWTVRSMHAPVFMLARVARALPRARAFHVVSTGYAGLAGAIASNVQRVPLILTEHGIYTKERRIELMQASWITDRGADERSCEVGFFRELWIRFFETLASITYAAADPIVTLFEGNRERQIADGADPARTAIIPNGIDLGRFRPLRARRPNDVPPILALIGRVVPIKDIKTFARAMCSVIQGLPDAEGWIVGPTVEDPRYAGECRELIASLGIEDRVRFLGLRNVCDILPRVGLIVLTSISEAMPLVLLEGFAAGVPCVTTEVGCARDLVEGGVAEDRALGAAGAVVGIADAEATARAALSLLRDGARWRAAQAAGVARVEAYYTQDLMLARYDQLYRRALRPTWQG
jgi:polysaccharide biosynthesis protein PelF